MKAKHENIRGTSLFYVFLSFPTDQSRLPDAFVVPSIVVADTLYRAHRAWLARPGRGGKPHKDGEMRRFLPDYTRENLGDELGPGWLEHYRDAWQLLAPET
ncbi:hypothetical protein [Sphingobium sp. YG1]|uniref:hypothetical protein n=1 Tax=Sphingobium sp. YG1 TaxID=2082188 RepID=UPI001E30C025|nr:hypothetical protein [Sphingobium sp. YG1]